MEGPQNDLLRRPQKDTNAGDMMSRKATDETGNVYGRLTVVRRGENQGLHASWRCECECGNETLVRGSDLRKGSSRSCGCLRQEVAREQGRERVIDETGNRYGRLTVLRRGPDQDKAATWTCRCDCGNECTTTGTRLRGGSTKSCGCLTRTHGHAGNQTATYNTWLAMKTRCTNPNQASYVYYGDVGITVCDAWMNSFEAFLDDMGERPEGRTLDRINPFGNYEPGNCKWSTPKEQANNRKKHWLERNELEQEAA